MGLIDERRALSAWYFSYAHRSGGWQPYIYIIQTQRLLSFTVFVFFITYLSFFLSFSLSAHTRIHIVAIGNHAQASIARRGEDTDASAAEGGASPARQLDPSS